MAPDEWIAKLIPSALSVAPRGSGDPGKMFVIFGMISQAVGTATVWFEGLRERLDGASTAYQREHISFPSGRLNRRGTVRREERSAPIRIFS